MNKQIEDMLKDNRDMVSVNTWDSFVENETFTNGCVTYIEATVQLVRNMESIMANSTDFDELKSQIVGLCNSRREFVEFAKLHLD